MFIIAAEIYVTGAVLFIILSAGKTQSWAAIESKGSTTLSSPKGSINEEDEAEGADEKEPLLSDAGGNGYSISRYDEST